jgi:hypothetical protein
VPPGPSSDECGCCHAGEASWKNGRDAIIR